MKILTWKKHIELRKQIKQYLYDKFPDNHGPVKKLPLSTLAPSSEKLQECGLCANDSIAKSIRSLWNATNNMNMVAEKIIQHRYCSQDIIYEDNKSNLFRLKDVDTKKKQKSAWERAFGKMR